MPGVTFAGAAAAGGTVIQTAFIVEDIHSAMRQFTQIYGAGPWFLRERGRFPVQTYRGDPTNIELAIAMGYCGDMQYELIQQLDDLPSVYRDVVAQRGYGLHHFGIVFEDFDTGCACYRQQGFDLAYEAQVSGGARVAYFDTLKAFPAMVEVIEYKEATRQMFGAFREAAHNWDGSEPVRLRPPLPSQQADTNT